MATPSVSLVETLIGAIPFEEGAALVARVGERATITARSGSIEVGSVALTVEAMDDLIAQVLPPDQLESLQENGTVHFPFKPQSISGDFAVLAASTPGDRWLEIRRRSTAGAPVAVPVADLPAAPVAKVPAVVSSAPFTTPAPAPAAAAVPVANDDDVAQLLSRFQAPEAGPTLAWDPEPAAMPQSAAFPSSFTAGQPLVESDFDLNIPALSAGEQPSSPQRLTPVLQGASTDDDLTVPAHLDFLEAKSGFDREGLTLPETLPPPRKAYETNAWLPDSDSDHIQIGEPAMSGTAASQVPTSAAARQPRRSLVKPLSAVLGFVVLATVGWFAAERYLSTPSAAVAQPPVPAPPRTAPPKAAPANTVSTSTPTTAAAASAPAAPQKAHADAGISKSVPTPAVIKANAETAAAPKPKTVPPAAPVTAPVVAKSATPAPTVPRDGYAVQVAAVIDRSEADRIVARLVSEGYSGYAIRGEGSAAGYIRVRVGAFKDRETAEEAAARLERSEGIKPWIVKETP